MALDGIPDQAVTGAIYNFIKGNVERKDRRFAPSTDELCAEAKRIWYAQIDKQNRIDAADRQLEQRPQELTPEDVARRKALVSGALQRISLVDAKIPMSLEDAKRELRELEMRPKQSIEVSDELANLIKQQTAA